jgi:hypothetical protein
MGQSRVILSGCLVRPKKGKPDAQGVGPKKKLEPKHDQTPCKGAEITPGTNEGVQGMNELYIRWRRLNMGQALRVGFFHRFGGMGFLAHPLGGCVPAIPE